MEFCDWKGEGEQQRKGAVKVNCYTDKDWMALFVAHTFLVHGITGMSWFAEKHLYASSYFLF